MSQTGFLKGACTECNGKIEFPAEGRGQKITCPHCGLKTVLLEPVASAQQQTEPVAAGTRRVSTQMLVIAALVILVGAIGLAYMLKQRQNGSAGESGASAGSSESRPAAQTNSSTASQPGKATNAAAVRVPAAPKSLSDLKVGSISLEKTKGSSLIYAVGILKNESDHQRFGVTIELGLMNDQGNQVGAARDYVPVIEPRAEWRFRVLVTDPKTVTATLASLKED